jgi:translation initiation factor 1
MRLFAGTPFDRPPTCDRCGALEADCTCHPLPAARIPAEQQQARLSVEKRKKGKMVTVVSGLPPDDNDLPGLLSQLKSKCGAGGTIKEQSIEIQGEHLERIRDVLRQIGYRVKG